MTSIVKGKPRFEVQGFIESGCYGKVYTAVDRETGVFLAAKFASEKDKNKGYKSFQREVLIQKRLNHENIVQMVAFLDLSDDNHASNFAPFLMMEHCICDIRSILMEYEILAPGLCKTISKQILTGLLYLESRELLHCDLKPENLLLSSDGNIKICDFGSARSFDYDAPASGFTLAYCPPEVLMGTTRFHLSTDLWSFGCIFAELWTGEIIFDDLSEAKVLKRIFKLCGSSPKESWYTFVPTLPNNQKIVWPRHYKSRLVRELWPKVDDVYVMDLIEKLLVPHPDKRCSCRDALSSTYFSSTPEAATLHDLVLVLNSKKVYTTVDRETGVFLAAKFANEKDKNKGYKSFQREVLIQKRLNHENIVQMVAFSDLSDDNHASNFAPFLMMEHGICDIRSILMEYEILAPGLSKTISRQILTGLLYLESREFLHCDLKPENLLLSSDGNIKICDFGSARSFDYDAPASGFTLAYCPPEVLMGATRFHLSTDLWSFGCIFAELWTGEIIFDDLSEAKVLKRIFKLCGSSPKEFWYTFVPTLPNNQKIVWPRHYKSRLVRELWPKVDDVYAMDLIEKLLVPHPDKRCSCRDALSSTYFSSTPEDATLHDLVLVLNSK